MLIDSLLCLSHDNFNSFTFATVAGKRNPRDLEKGFFQLKFQKDVENLEMYLGNVPLVVVESMAFYEVTI